MWCNHPSYHTYSGGMVRPIFLADGRDTNGPHYNSYRYFLKRRISTLLAQSYLFSPPACKPPRGASPAQPRRSRLARPSPGLGIRANGLLEITFETAAAAKASCFPCPRHRGAARVACGRPRQRHRKPTPEAHRHRSGGGGSLLTL